jgi:hypothetical protein
MNGSELNVNAAINMRKVRGHGLQTAAEIVKNVRGCVRKTDK